jgi:hypothetical protein
MLLLVLGPQLCLEHGISKDGMLEDFATQVRSAPSARSLHAVARSAAMARAAGKADGKPQRAQARMAAIV